jgi:hypothetical protein
MEVVIALTTMNAVRSPRTTAIIFEKETNSIPWSDYEINQEDDGKENPENMENNAEMVEESDTGTRLRSGFAPKWT